MQTKPHNTGHDLQANAIAWLTPMDELWTLWNHKILFAKALITLLTVLTAVERSVLAEDPWRSLYTEGY